MSSPPTERALFLLPLAAAFGYGSLGVLVTLARADGLGLAAVLAWRFVIAALLLTPATWWVLRRLRSAAALPTLALAVALGAVGFAMQSFCYLSAVSRLGAGRAAVLLYSYPFYVLLLDWAVNARRPYRAQLGALALAFGGCCLTAWAPGGTYSAAGVAYALATGVIYAVYVIVSDRLVRRLGAVPQAWGVSIGAGLSFAALAAWEPVAARPASATAWGLLAALGLVATVLPFVALFVAMRRLGPTRAAILAMAEPAFAVALGVVVLHEAFAGSQVLGAVLVTAGGMLLAASPVALTPRP